MVIKGKLSNSALRSNIFAMGLLVPSILLIGFTILYPVIVAARLSSTSYSLIKPDSDVFINFKNYFNLFKDELFWSALKNTIVIISLTIFGGFTVGLSFALLLNQKIVFRNFFRGIALIPWVIPGVVTSLLFLYMFNHNYGFINFVLKNLHIISTNINWFGNPKFVLIGIILAHIWTQFPFYMLMFLATLQTIPNDIIEAAEIDGANLFKKFFYITLPYLRNIIVIATTLMVIWNFNAFDIIWATTKGGPAFSTTTLAIYVYKMAFTHYELGYASSIGIAWLVILLIFSYFYIRLMEKKSR